jgi:outer membrane protein TolC
MVLHLVIVMRVFLVNFEDAKLMLISILQLFLIKVIHPSQLTHCLVQQLNELEEQVDPSNQILKVAEGNFRQARAAIRFNRAAEAPTIGIAPSVSAVRASANQPYFSQSLVNNGTGALTLPVDLSYEIDLWGRIRRSVAAATEQAQASAADLETVRLSLHAEVAPDYFEVRSPTHKRSC